jgi:hypothetical protein
LGPDAEDGAWRSRSCTLPSFASSSCSASQAVGNKTWSLRSSCSVTRLLSCAAKLFVPPCGRRTELFWRG